MGDRALGNLSSVTICDTVSHLSRFKPLLRRLHACGAEPSASQRGGRSRGRPAAHQRLFLLPATGSQGEALGHVRLIIHNLYWRQVESFILHKQHRTILFQFNSFSSPYKSVAKVHFEQFLIYSIYLSILSLSQVFYVKMSHQIYKIHV